MKKLLLFLLLPLFANAQETILKGVVSYYFNNNYGNKPDIGSEVTLIKEKDIEAFTNEYNSCNTKELIEEKYKLEYAYKIAKSNLNNLPWTTKSRTERFYKSKVDSVNRLINTNATNIAKSEACEIVVMINYKKNNKDRYYTTVDGSGNYSIKIPSGNYLISIRSDGRGYTILKPFEVIEGRENNFSYNFDLISYTGVMFIK